ncbi:MAG: hypothetical protein CMN05_01195 [Roseibacillus sp.]|nr:hypothetical protein [Roseibacillus sp.]
MEPSPDKDKIDRLQPDPKMGDLGPKEGEFIPETGDPMAVEPDSGISRDSVEEPLDMDKPLESVPDRDSPDQDPEKEEDSASISEEKAPSFLPKFSRNDFLWLGALLLALVGVMIIALRLFFNDINTKSTDDVDFPVKGDNVVIKKIDTYWRKTDREKDTGVQLNTKFIPAAEVLLKSSEEGSLRFFFENPEGDLVGDPVTLTFSGGNFRETGEKNADIHATGGFEDLGDYNEYLTEKVHFWHLIVMEGPGLQPGGSDFKEIMRMRVSPRRR